MIEGLIAKSLKDYNSKLDVAWPNKVYTPKKDKAFLELVYGTANLTTLTVGTRLKKLTGTFTINIRYQANTGIINKEVEGLLSYYNGTFENDEGQKFRVVSVAVQNGVADFSFYKTSVVVTYEHFFSLLKEED